MRFRSRVWPKPLVRSSCWVHSDEHVESAKRRRSEPSRRGPGRARHTGPCAAGKPGVDPVELVVDGETFVVTRRADSPRTFDFDWTSHPESYGFTVGMNFDWMPDRAELIDQVRSFLAEIDPETGYLPD